MTEAQDPSGQPIAPQPAPQPLIPEPVSAELAALEQAALERAALERAAVERAAVERAAAARGASLPSPRLGDGDASLLELVDRLTVLLQRSDLAELEVEAGGTGLVLRKPSALATDPVSAVTIDVGPPAEPPAAAAPPERPSIKAPLTGIYYGSPAPGSAPFVRVGSELAVGTVIGLIEAMKLFNEIKSDLAGRVVRVVAESGALVKAKQPLIEVEPL
jgi:acetyl-CoA carboxylase biotin carboxyl carrier protein